MFSRKSPQTSLLDAEFFLPNSKRKRLENSWPGVFRQEIFPVLLEIEPEFARFYHPTEGAPNKAAAVMLGLNILQDMFDLSDGEVVEAFDFNAQWHYALETSPDLAHVCAKTLYTFRRFLTTDEMARRVFERATDRFIEKWNVRTTRHRLDSTHILSNVSRLSRVGLFVKTIEQFLKRLKRKSPELLAALPCELRERYLERGGYFADVKGSRVQRRLEQCAGDLWLLVERFRGRKSVASLQAYLNLARLFDEQCVVAKSGQKETLCVNVKAPKEVASDSLQTPSDPDATFSGHKGEGYQAQVAETCHEENALELIDYVESEGAHNSDLNAPGRVHENLKSRAHTPGTTYADAGYISGKNIIEAEGQGVDLQGPTELGKRPKADKAPLSDFEFTAERTRVGASERFRIHRRAHAGREMPSRPRADRPEGLEGRQDGQRLFRKRPLRALREEKPLPRAATDRPMGVAFHVGQRGGGTAADRARDVGIQNRIQNPFGNRGDKFAAQEPARDAPPARARIPGGLVARDVQMPGRELYSSAQTRPEGDPGNADSAHRVLKRAKYMCFFVKKSPQGRSAIRIELKSFFSRA
jgi:hypothetical protein